MTENKMPGVIWAWMGMQDNGSWDHKPCPCCECSKFYCAEPIEALLRQARDALEFYANDGLDHNCKDAITAIDQFLTTTKGER